MISFLEVIFLVKKIKLQVDVDYFDKGVVNERTKTSI